MAEFIAMGGYAFYVWTSYGIVVIALVGAAFLPWQKHRRLRRDR